ncbi:MAG: hypothetical protein MJZ99_07185 [Bacteroidales bacterium]|nr:hypothetical protein [Bacteroidales bacterium]
MELYEYSRWLGDIIFDEKLTLPNVFYCLDNTIHTHSDDRDKYTLYKTACVDGFKTHKQGDCLFSFCGKDIIRCELTSEPAYVESKYKGQRALLTIDNGEHHAKVWIIYKVD